MKLRFNFRNDTVIALVCILLISTFNVDADRSKSKKKKVIQEFDLLYNYNSEFLEGVLKLGADPNITSNGATAMMLSQG